jgi:outer membrane protein OmpA-like peptidoglycan-associated protein
VDSISKKVTYTDDYQSTSFRGSLFTSKQIEVTYNEAIYILVNNLSGPDLGHVIDLQTCDYSYVLKVNKEIIKTDAEDELEYLRKEFSAPLDRLKSIADKLCANSNDKKMGYSNFLGDAMATKNLNSAQVDSASVVQAKAIKKLDSLAGKPTPDMLVKKTIVLTDQKTNTKPTITKPDSTITNLKSTTVTDSIATKKNIKELIETKEIIKDSVSTQTNVKEINESKTSFVDSVKTKFVTKKDTIIETNSITEKRKKTVVKTSYNYGEDYPPIFSKSDSVATLVDTTLIKSKSIKFIFQLKDSIFDVITELKLNNENNKTSSLKKIKPPKKTVDVYFTVIDATSKKIIPNPKLRFYKKNNSKNDFLIYHDSICSYSSEFLNSNKWILKCDLFGYLPFEEYFNYNNCINVDDQLYYLILISPLKKGDKLALPNVFFFANSTVLKQKSYTELDKLVEYLNSNPAKISINGHTQGNHRIDNVGKTVEEQYRFKGSASKLSKKRAEIVYNYLIQKGIPKERLTIKGYAGRKPIIKHPKNKKERELNMRVEVKIIDINKKYAAEKALPK